MMLLVVLLLGIVIGSFLNLVIDRIPRGEQILLGRSHCDNCRRPLSVKDLVPILSRFLLGGKCRYCKIPIPERNTIVEAVTVGVFALTAYLLFGTGTISGETILLLGLNLIVASLLIAIFFIDLEHMIIPDSLLLALLLAAVAIHTISTGLPLPNLLLSSILAGGFFMSLVIVTRGRGMGLGDVKYAGVMGLLLGFPNTVYALYVAFLTGAFFSVILILKHKKRFGQTIPFGPFLVVGTLLAHLHILEPVGRRLFPF